MRGAVGHRHQRHELRLQIGGKAGKRCGGRRRPHAAARRCDAPIRPRLVGVDFACRYARSSGISAPIRFGARADQFDLAAGHRRGDGIGAGLDAVGHARRARPRRSVFDAVDDDLATCRGRKSSRPWRSGSGRDRRSPVRARRSRARSRPWPAPPPSAGFRSRRPRRTGNSIRRALQAVWRAGDDIAVGEIDLGAQRLQRP